MRSGLDAEATRQRIIAKMTEVADVLESTAWRIPAVPPFDFRGTLAEPGWDGAPRLLFLQKAMHTLTGDGKWARHYEQSLHGKDGPRRKSDLTRLQSCEAGVASRPRPQMWTVSVSNACLRELWELERDETVRGFYTRGLQASAAFASTQLAQAREFDHDSAKPYDGDWRKLNDLWRPQKTSGEASDVSEPQRSRKTGSPRALARRRDSCVNPPSPRGSSRSAPIRKSSPNTAPPFCKHSLTTASIASISPASSRSNPPGGGCKSRAEPAPKAP